MQTAIAPSPEDEGRRLFSSRPVLDRLAGPFAWAFSLLAVTFPVFDVDLYWHLANGRAMRELGRIVNEDVLSFTHQGVPFVNHEWLSQWLFFGLWDSWGWAGLMGLKLLLASVVAGLLFKTARYEGASPWNAALLTSVAVMAGVFRFHVRPELFSLAGLALLQFILLRHRKRPSAVPLWGLPVLFLVWDWLHGAIIGWAYFICFVLFVNLFRYQARDKRKKPELPGDIRNLNFVLVASVLVSLINPYGLRSYEHFWILAMGSHGADRILELQPVWHNMGSHPLLVGVLLVVLVALVFRAGKEDRVVSLMAALFTLAAIRYLRFAEVSMIVVVPFLAYRFSGGGRKLPWILATAWIVLALVFLQEKVINSRATLSPGGSYVLPSQTAFGFGANDFLAPAGSASFVKKHDLSGDFYNNANLGGYLAFVLGPERKIFQFNMPPVFGDSGAMVRNYREFRSLGLDIGFAGNSRELERLFPAQEWACVYNDYVSSLMVRRVPRFADLIRRHEIRHFLPEMTGTTLRQLGQKTEIRDRLMFEMAEYLECMEDERIANVYEEMVARHGEPESLHCE